MTKMPMLSTGGKVGESEAERCVGRRVVLVIWVALLSASCSSCAIAGNAAPDERNADLFINPSKRIGERVVVRGILHWRFEDRSLYPTERDSASDRLCLPVLIRSKRRALIDEARVRDGAAVEISGEVVPAARPGMVSVSTCKQVGIEVESIR